jgi:hypothetical protein
MQVGRPEFFTTAYFHTPGGLAGEIGQAGFTGLTIYGAEGPGWPLRQEWADPCAASTACSRHGPPKRNPR